MRNMAKSFYFWRRKIAATSIHFCLHIRGLDLSITRESFFVAPHAFSTNAAEMIKDDISYLRFLTDTIGCIAIGEVIPVYLWDPDTSQPNKSEGSICLCYYILGDPINNLLRYLSDNWEV